MGAVSRPISRDAPEAYIPSDRRAAIAADVTLPDRAQGAALFADIAGFTALTEALATELGGHRASEELTANLNRVFHALIAEVDAYGGSVIYFSGGPVTRWVDGGARVHARPPAVATQDGLPPRGRAATRAPTLA